MSRHRCELRSLTERLLRGHTLDCALPAAPITREPDLETRRGPYLFCKEVLHNVARHAQTTRVRFHLTPTAEGLRFEIRDNGIGFDPQQAGNGHGLSNLNERARAMHATLHLQSQPEFGYGTVPLPKKVPRANPDDRSDVIGHSLLAGVCLFLREAMLLSTLFWSRADLRGLNPTRTPPVPRDCLSL